jgi:hypothetical protein
MATVLWDLVNGRNFNPVGSFTQGMQQGQAFRNEREKRSVLAELAAQGGEMDYDQAAARLLPYDPQTANTLAQLGMRRDDQNYRRETRQDDVAWRREESQRAQRNADRSYGLQASQANRPDIQMVEDSMGNKTPVLINRQTGEMRPLGGVTPRSPANPYAPGGKTTEGQANAGLYGTRMANSHQTIGKLEGINSDTAGGIAGTAEEYLPGAVFNRLATPDRQMFMQAKRDFINAALRRESGAAISPSEFANAEQQYFPQPGDSPQVIQQKRMNRETAIKGIMGAAGPHYQPPESFRQGGSPQQSQPAAGQISEGATATNPQTGQKIMFRGGQWVPAQ